MSGCANSAGGLQTVIEPRVERQRVPGALLDCAPHPEPTEADMASQKAVGLYVVRLAGAGEDCRAKLEAVRQLVEEQ